MDVKLISIGEIRFGPPFFKLEIDGTEIPNKIFGDVKYEDSSHYIVLQEWLSTDYARGPRTRPFIIDTLSRKYAVLSDGKAGFAESLRIDGDLLIYTQTNWGTGINKIYECELKSLIFEHSL